MAKQKTVNTKEFYSEDFDEYLTNLHKLNPDAETPLIIKANTTAEAAASNVEALIKDRKNIKKDDKNFNVRLLNLIAKKGVKPTVKKVYQNVLLTYFKTKSVEYDYSYRLNEQFIDISPKKISINQGHAEFACATQCYSSDKKINDDTFPKWAYSYKWEKITDNMLTQTPEPEYVFANLNKSDLEKDSKESMRQYNIDLRRWVKDYQQEELGTARRVYKANIYDKDYSYSETKLLAPFLLVSYDLGNMIITFSVCAITGKVETMTLNDPAARFDFDLLAPPSFSIPVFILLSICFIIAGSVLYILSFIGKKLTYASKVLHGYTVPELKKLL